MTKYNFNLHSFTINNRRTNHPFGGGTDTVKIAAALQVGDYKYPALYRAAGDLGDTGKEYIQDLAFQDVEINDLNTPIKFSFVITNSGHGDDAKIQAALTEGANYLVGLAANAIPAAGFWGLVVAGGSALVKALVDKLIPIFFSNCDGLVASDVFAFRARDLLTTTDGKVWGSTRDYPGLESPSGCGSNSNYRVNCTITQIARNVHFGGLWTPGNDAFEIDYGDSWDVFNSTTFPNAAKAGLRPVQIWFSPWDGGRWGGLFQAGSDPSTVEYGDSYDAFNERLKQLGSQGQTPANLHIMQNNGGAQYAAAFRTRPGKWEIVYGDGYDTFVKQTIPSLGSKGLSPVQLWRLWGDDGSSTFGGLFREGAGSWSVAWGDSYDTFNNETIAQQQKAGRIPAQVLLGWNGPELRVGALFRQGLGPCSIVYGDAYDYFNNTRSPQLNKQGMRMSQFWTIA
jgi:hypothetical protein